MSRIALAGGNEFRRDCDDMDRELLAAMGGRGAMLAIIPTAATNENPYVAGEHGIRHFRRLGAAPDKLLFDEDNRDDAEMTNVLRRFSAVYFTGGDPVYLLETLRGSRLWEVVVDLHARGGLVAGSSAGAMVLGEWMWRFGEWTPGLGLARGLAVLPHHATMASRWDAPAMSAALPAGVTLLGIDEATAVLLPEGRVLGLGQVTRYTADGPHTYRAGEIAVEAPA